MFFILQLYDYKLFETSLKAQKNINNLRRSVSYQQCQDTGRGAVKDKENMEAKGRKGKITPASGIKDKKEKQRKEREGGGSKKYMWFPR